MKRNMFKLKIPQCLGNMKEITRTGDEINFWHDLNAREI